MTSSSGFEFFFFSTKTVGVIHIDRLAIAISAEFQFLHLKFNDLPNTVADLKIEYQKSLGLGFLFTSNSMRQVNVI